MNILKRTASLCPTCFKQVPAVIGESHGAVWMHKECSAHGVASELVERSPEFYRWSRSLGDTCPSAHFVIDITQRCNIRCRYCYYPLKNHADGEPTRDAIKQEIDLLGLDPVFSGGEPTVRDDLPALIEFAVSRGHKPMILTNGIALADFDYLTRVADAGLLTDAKLKLGMSMHGEGYSKGAQYKAKRQALSNIRANGWRISELMFTVSSVSEARSLIPTLEEYADVAEVFRIRSPFNNWAEQNATVKLFVSELIDAYRSEGSMAIVPGADNGLYHSTFEFVPGRHHGLGMKLGAPMNLRLICCPDKFNVDLGELQDYPPFHRANNGEVLNLMHSFMVNEGMAKGWLHGKRFEMAA